MENMNAASLLTNPTKTIKSNTRSVVRVIERYICYENIC